MFHTGIAILHGMNQLGLHYYTTVWREVGISDGTLSSLISGKQQPSLGMLNRLARFFEVPLSTFILWGEQDLNIDQLKEDLKWR